MALFFESHLSEKAFRKAWELRQAETGGHSLQTASKLRSRSSASSKLTSRAVASWSALGLQRFGDSLGLRKAPEGWSSPKRCRACGAELTRKRHGLFIMRVVDFCARCGVASLDTVPSRQKRDFVVGCNPPVAELNVPDPATFHEDGAYRCTDYPLL